MDTIETTGVYDKLDWRTQWRRLRTLRWKDLGVLFIEVFNRWSEHNIPRLGASVAFYTLLSLAPLLIVVVAIAGAVFGREAAEGRLVWQIQDLIGRPGAETVQTLLRTTQRPGAGILASIIGTLALIMGSTSVVSELRDALNVIWCVPKREMSRLRSIIALVQEKTFAFATVLGIGFLLLISLAVNAAVSGFSEYYQGWLPRLAAVVIQWIDFVLAYLVIAALFALIYKLLPDIRLEWRDVIPGALITALLFSVGRLLIGIYLGRASYSSVYGAAGSLVALLVWVYYSAQIFFLGAEFTRAYAQAFGSKPCDRIGKEVTLATALSEIDHPKPNTDGNEPMVRLS